MDLERLKPLIKVADELGEEMFLGNGFIPDTHDSRDFKSEELFGAPEPFDWDKGFDIEEYLGVKLPVNDQKSTFSCVSQAKSKDRETKEYQETGKYLPYSVTSVYSLRPNTPQKGMQLRDGCKIEQNIGIALRSDVPDIPEEARMNEKAPEGVYRTKSLSYVSFSFWNDIEALATHIRDYGTVMIGYDGRNNGTNKKEHPDLPQKPEEKQWGHCVLGGKAKMVNGEKRVYFLNSWGEDCGVKGWQYFTEDDFKLKDGYSPFYKGWVTVDLKNFDISNMTKEFLAKNHGKLVQDTQSTPTHKASGAFGVIVDGVIRTGSSSDVIATYLAIKEGAGVPREIWDNAPKKPV